MNVILDRVVNRHRHDVALHHGLALPLQVVPAMAGVGIAPLGIMTEVKETIGNTKREKRANIQSTDLVTIDSLHILQSGTPLQSIPLTIGIALILARGVISCLNLVELCFSPRCLN